jgi:hypothetical protein
MVREPFLAIARQRLFGSGLSSAGGSPVSALDKACQTPITAAVSQDRHLGRSSASSTETM